MKLAVPRSRALVGVILYGALIFGGAFSFAYYALVRIHAGLGQTLLAPRPARDAAASCAAAAGTPARRSSRRNTPLRRGHRRGFGTFRDRVGASALAPGRSGRCPLLRGGDRPAATLPAGPSGGDQHRRDGRRRGDPCRAVAAFRESIALPARGATWLAIAYLVVLGSGPVFVLYVVVVRLGAPPGRRTPSSSFRWSPCCCRRGSTTSRSARDSSSEACWCSQGCTSVHFARLRAELSRRRKRTAQCTA